ncbi:Uncharacterised protein [Escherichia coli]|nr:Uncharacterised protein [Escherichia coli]VWN20824.1 Uncharacterised protein [Escherichia coli]
MFCFDDVIILRKGSIVSSKCKSLLYLGQKNASTKYWLYFIYHDWVFYIIEI